MRPFTQILAREVESLQARVVPIGDIDHAPIVHGDAVRLIKLPRTGSFAAPLADTLPLTGVFKHARVAVSIGDVDAAIWTEGDVGSAIAGAPSWRLLADGDLHQLFSARGEFQDHRTAG